MSIPALVPIFDLEMFKGTAFDLSFEAEVMNTDGTSQDPQVFYDLTGKSIVLTINDVFRPTFVLDSADGANANGSVITIASDRTLGQFQLHLDETDMALVKTKIGYYRIAIRASGVDDEVIVRGTVSIIPFDAQGDL